MKEDSIVVKIGNQSFTAVLLNNETAKSFKALLPLTLKMTDLMPMKSMLVSLNTYLLIQ
jgi:hypothetical protein